MPSLMLLQLELHGRHLKVGLLSSDQIFWCLRLSELASMKKQLRERMRHEKIAVQKCNNPIDWS